MGSLRIAHPRCDFLKWPPKFALVNDRYSVCMLGQTTLIAGSLDGSPRGTMLRAATKLGRFVSAGTSTG
jgi:hypothetical protein